MVCVNKMDLVDWTRTRSSDQRGVHRVRRRLDFAGRHRSSRSARCTATTWSTAPSTCPGTRARRCWTTSSTWRSRRDRNLEDAALPGAVGRAPASRPSTTTTAATPARWPAACSRPATRWSCCPPAARTRIAAIDSSDGELDEAFPPMSVTLLLEDDIDVSRGDTDRRPPRRARAGARARPPTSAGWPTRRCAPGARYAIKHTTRTAARDGRGDRAPRRHPHAASTARPTSWAQRHRPRAPAPLARRSWPTPTRATATTGSFILIDEATNDTVGAGMIV